MVGSRFAPEPSDTSTGFLLRSMRCNGDRLPYAVYVPRSYDARTPVPAIFFLHGVGECGDDGLRQLGPGLGSAIIRAPRRWPFIAVFPQKPDAWQEWAAYRDILLAILDRTQDEYLIDERCTAVTGISQGGAGAWALAAADPALWSAVVPICGYGRPDEIAGPLKHTAVWCFHGENDDVVPIAHSINIVDALRVAGGAPRFTAYTGVGHDSWTRAYAEHDLPRWLLAQRARTLGEPVS